MNTKLNKWATSPNRRKKQRNGQTNNEWPTKHTHNNSTKITNSIEILYATRESIYTFVNRSCIHFTWSETVSAQCSSTNSFSHKILWHYTDLNISTVFLVLWIASFLPQNSVQSPTYWMHSMSILKLIWTSEIEWCTLTKRRRMV